jgi:hypothetical protein
MILKPVKKHTKPVSGSRFREHAKRIAVMRSSKKKTGPVHQRTVAARKSAAGRY